MCLGQQNQFLIKIMYNTSIKLRTLGTEIFLKNIGVIASHLHTHAPDLCILTNL
jgi:hypothetical protein